MKYLIMGATAWMNKQLERISAVKDKVVIFFGLVYVIGYVVWSVNALVNNLGVLPAFQLQYLIAGFVPVILIFLTWGIWSSTNWFLQKKWPSFVGPEATGWRGFIRNLVPSLFLISMITMFVQVFLHLHGTMYIVIVYVMAVSLILLPPDLLADNKIFRCLQKFYRVLIIGFFPLMFSVVIFSFFWVKIYPAWPQELGGVKPRCAFLDIDKGHLSWDTEKVLFPQSIHLPASGTVRSIQLDVYYTGGDSFLVKPHQASGKSPETYEINKSNIESIEWCT